MSRSDLVVGVVSIVIGALFAYQSTQLSLFQDGTPGPGLYPLVIASALGICGGLLITVNLVKQPRRRTDPAGEQSGGESMLVDVLEHSAEPHQEPSATSWLKRAGRATLVWVAIAVGVVLLGIVGFLPAMAVLVALLLWGVERTYTVGSVAAVVLIPGAGYVIFETLLGLELPTGLLGL